jgi:adenosine deaminase
MCPLSNVRTNVVDCLREHPIRRFFDAGIVVTVNTDDPKMFQTSLAEEYRLLGRECGFTKPEIRAMILSAVAVVTSLPPALILCSRGSSW